MFFNKEKYRRKKLVNKEAQKKRKRAKLIIAVLTIITIAATTTPDLHLEKQLGMKYTEWFDMLQHGGYYFLLGVTVFLIFPERKYIQLILFVLCLGSLVLEVAQAWIPGRTFTLLDITSNYLGITLAFLVNLIIRYYRNKRKRQVLKRA